MTRRYRQKNQPFPAITCVLLLILLCPMTLLFTACDSEEGAPETGEVATITGEVTTTTKEASIEYPWKSIVAQKGYLPHGVKADGYYLEVYIDPGKELSFAEAEAMENKVSLAGNDGSEYGYTSYGSGSGLTIYSYDEGKLLWEWTADFAYSFGFVVESETIDYEFIWSGYPPLDIGNPFETTYVSESE